MESYSYIKGKPLEGGVSPDFSFKGIYFVAVAIIP